MTFRAEIFLGSGVDHANLNDTINPEYRIDAYGERVMQGLTNALFKIPEFKDALAKKYLSGGAGSTVEFEFGGRSIVAQRSVESLQQIKKDTLSIEVTDPVHGKIRSGVSIDTQLSNGEIQNVDVLATDSSDTNKFKAVRDLANVLISLRF